MNKQVFLLLFSIFVSFSSSFAQPPPRTPEQIRNETSQRNQQIEDYDRSSRNNSIILRESPISSQRRYKIPGSEVRKYILAAPAETSATVISVISGDMLLVNNENRRLTVRIIGIDAPEPGQSFFDEARKNLSELVLGKKVVLKYSLHNLTDENNHFFVRVIADEEDIGLKSIKSGSAWYRKEEKYFLEKSDCEIYEQAETEARSNRSGIWVEKNPQKPWEYRHETSKQIIKARKKAEKN